MGSSVPRFVWYRLRSTLHRRWGSYLTVALLVGLVGGLAMGSVAAARRTQSTFPSYLEASHSSNLQFQAYLGGGTPQANLYSPKFADEIAHLPQVRSVAAAADIFGLPYGTNGKPFLPAPFANNEVQEVAPVNGLYYSVDAITADRGKVPDPGSVNQFAVTSQALRLMHWHVGQVITFGFDTVAEVATSGIGVPAGLPALRVRARLVGVVALDTAVVHDEVDAYPTFAIFSPGLTQRLIGVGAAGYPTYSIRLRQGGRDVSAVERELIGLLPSGAPYNFHVTSVVEGQVERATKPESIALGVFGLIAALAALLIASQAIGRGIRTNRQELQILQALGAGPAMLGADSLTGILGAVLVGSLLAAVVCVAISPFSPLGVVRQVDPSPGFNFDWTVLGAGFGIFFVFLTAAAIGLTFLAVRRGAARQSVGPTKEYSQIVGWAARIGLPPASIAGIRFAVERRSGQDSVPVGSALLGAVLAVAVVVTTLTFGNGLSTLVSHPALYGWNWSYAIQSAGNSGSVPPAATLLLDRDKYVSSWSGFNFADAQIDGQTVPILLQKPNASVTAPILSGHELETGSQVVLGGTTLAQLHKHVGDTVVASYGSPKDYPVYVPPTRLRIVGTATMPAIGNPGTLHVSMGAGAIIPKGIEPRAMQQALTNPDPNLNGYDLVAVRLRSGLDQAAAFTSLQRIAAKTSSILDSDPNSGGGTFQVLPVQQPAEIVNYKTMGATPAILASGLAASAIVALALTLVASVRRRRRDLALLKTLGFVQRQVASVVSWQASVAALIGVVVGVPAGIIFGRVLWSTFANEIYAVPRPAVPVLQIFLAAIGALALANIVAWLPGRIAARTPTAALLRTE